jgi:hypothetical protein
MLHFRQRLAILRKCVWLRGHDFFLIQSFGIRSSAVRGIALWRVLSSKLYLISRRSRNSRRSASEAQPSNAPQSISRPITLRRVVLVLDKHEDGVDQTQERRGAQPDTVFRVRAEKLPAGLGDGHQGYAEQEEESCLPRYFCQCVVCCFHDGPERGQG